MAAWTTIASLILHSLLHEGVSWSIRVKLSSHSQYSPQCKPYKWKILTCLLCNVITCQKILLLWLQKHFIECFSVWSFLRSNSLSRYDPEIGNGGDNFSVKNSTNLQQRIGLHKKAPFHLGILFVWVWCCAISPLCPWTKWNSEHRKAVLQ